MAQADYHYIENYSNVGKIGISYTAMGEMLKENIKDIEHVTISKGITFEVGKDKVLNVNIGLKVDYGTNINDVSELIQERICTALANMCEITNVKTNIKLEGIIVK
ncbi:MAG: Asp23/Gls24 family envelope stress response protein [Bacilli bacterium]|nr:Asp23/Gls24 family envelope stress response protein [Bacilli bacterium]